MGVARTYNPTGTPLGADRIRINRATVTAIKRYPRPLRLAVPDVRRPRLRRLPLPLSRPHGCRQIRGPRARGARRRGWRAADDHRRDVHPCRRWSGTAALQRVDAAVPACDGRRPRVLFLRPRGPADPRRCPLWRPGLQTQGDRLFPRQTRHRHSHDRERRHRVLARPLVELRVDDEQAVAHLDRRGRPHQRRILEA